MYRLSIWGGIMWRCKTFTQFTPLIMTPTGRYCLTMAREIYTNFLMTGSVERANNRKYGDLKGLAYVALEAADTKFSEVLQFEGPPNKIYYFTSSKQRRGRGDGNGKTSPSDCSSLNVRVNVRRQLESEKKRWENEPHL